MDGSKIEINWIKKELEEIKKLIQDIRDEMKDDFVTHAEFAPYKAIVYGLVALVLVWVAKLILNNLSL